MKIGDAVIICSRRGAKKNAPIFGRPKPEPAAINSSQMAAFENGTVGIVISETRTWEYFTDSFNEKEYKFRMVLTSRGSYWFREHNLEVL